MGTHLREGESKNNKYILSHWAPGRAGCLFPEVRSCRSFCRTYPPSFPASSPWAQTEANNSSCRKSIPLSTR